MKTVVVIVVAVVLATGSLFLFFKHGAALSSGPSLVVYCASGVKKPIEAVAKAYRKEFGVAVELQYGGTASLLSAIRVAKRGDLFVAADAAAIDEGRRLGLLREVLPVACQTPVLAVPKGNPKGIKSLDDLGRNDVRFALANPESASISRVTKRVLAGRWEGFSRNAAVLKPTVMDIASDVTLGTVDAAVVWDSTVAQFPALERVNVPEFAEATETVGVAVLAACRQPVEALRFARYLTAPEKGTPILASQGFLPVRGDAWSVKPKLVFYSGGLNRLGVQTTLQEFAAREGVDLTTVFNGCGILCASMRAMTRGPGGKAPDAYYACDVSFMRPMADLYPVASILTEADIMLAVAKGNPKALTTLADLARPGLKIGICNSEQSTLGFLTRAMLKDLGLLDTVMMNVCSQVPTADLLVNQLRTGSLDAAIVYNVNARAAGEAIDTVAINHVGAIATQPFAVATNSPNTLLAYRLLEMLRANRARSESVGFRWRGEAPPVASTNLSVPSYLIPKHD